MRRVLALALLVIAPSLPRPTGACSPFEQNGGELAPDPDFADDTTPPSAVTASASLLLASDSGDGGGCGGDKPTCGNGGPFVVVSVTATDDRSLTGQLGYTVDVVGGTPPANLQLPATAVLASVGELRLRFSGDDDFAFELEVRAVDQNGNAGPPTRVAVASDD